MDPAKPSGEPSRISARPESGDVDHSFDARYGELLVSRGIATFPSLLLRWQKELRLEDRHLITLLVILSFYRAKGDTPSVSIDRMASWRGMSWEKVRETLWDLSDLGYILQRGRDNKHGSYHYDPSGLFRVLNKLASYEENQAQQQKARQADRQDFLRELSTPDEANRDQHRDQQQRDESQKQEKQDQSQKTEAEDTKRVESQMSRAEVVGTRSNPAAGNFVGSTADGRKAVVDGGL